MKINIQKFFQAIDKINEEESKGEGTKEKNFFQFSKSDYPGSYSEFPYSLGEVKRMTYLQVMLMIVLLYPVEKEDVKRLLDSGLLLLRLKNSDLYFEGFEGPYPGEHKTVLYNIGTVGSDLCLLTNYATYFHNGSTASQVIRGVSCTNDEEFSEFKKSLAEELPAIFGNIEIKQPEELYNSVADLGGQFRNSPHDLAIVFKTSSHFQLTTAINSELNFHGLIKDLYGRRVMTNHLPLANERKALNLLPLVVRANNTTTLEAFIRFIQFNNPKLTDTQIIIEPNLIFHAIEANHIDMVKFCAEKRIPLESRCTVYHQGRTLTLTCLGAAIHFANEIHGEQMEDVIRYLITQGANYNCRIFQEDGYGRKTNIRSFDFDKTGLLSKLVNEFKSQRAQNRQSQWRKAQGPYTHQPEEKPIDNQEVAKLRKEVKQLQSKVVNLEDKINHLYQLVLGGDNIEVSASLAEQLQPTVPRSVSGNSSFFQSQRSEGGPSENPSTQTSYEIPRSGYNIRR